MSRRTTKIRSLKFKIFSSVLLAVLVIFAAYATVTFVTARRALLAESEQKIEARLQEKVNELNTFFAEKLTLVEVAQADPRLADWVQQARRGADVEADLARNARIDGYDAMLTHAQQIAAQDPDIRLLYWGSLASNYVYKHTGEPTRDGYELDQRPWFQSIRDRMGPIYSAPYISASFGELTVTAGAPLLDEGGTLVGSYAVDLSLQNVVEKLQTLSFGEGSYAFAYGSDGTLYVHPDTNLVMQARLDELPFDGVAAHTEAMLNDDAGRFVTTADGEEAYLMYAHIPTTRWGVGVVVPSALIQAPLAPVKALAWGSLVLIALLIGLVVYVIAARIAGPVRQFAARFEDLSQGEGDLRVRMDATSRDELGLMGRWFNLFMDRLSDVLQAVVRSVHTISGFATDIEAQGQDALAKVDRQNAALREVKHATEEIQQSTHAVDEHAARQAQAADQVGRFVRTLVDSFADETARLGGLRDDVVRISQVLEDLSRSSASVAGHMTDAVRLSQDNARRTEAGHANVEALTALIDGISDAFRDSAGMIADLDDDISAVDEVVSLIDDFAEQTNMLALNAAIEAARAGEAGRGFAIVADETRKLAERTADATHQISAKIRGMKAQSAAVVEAVGTVAEQAEEGRRRAQESGRTFGEIAGSIGSLDAIVQDVQVEADRQREGVEAVAGTVHAMRDAVVEMAERAQQQTAESHHVQEAADDLATLSATVARAMAAQKQHADGIAKELDDLLTLSLANQSFLRGLLASIHDMSGTSQALSTLVQQFTFEQEPAAAPRALPYPSANGPAGDGAADRPATRSARSTAEHEGWVENPRLEILNPKS